MNYEEFCAALQEELFNRLDTSCSIHRERVLKNNGVVLDSLALLRLEKHCSPVISLEMLYDECENGRTLADLWESMVSNLKVRPRSALSSQTRYLLPGM